MYEILYYDGHSLDHLHAKETNKDKARMTHVVTNVCKICFDKISYIGL